MTQPSQAAIDAARAAQAKYRIPASVQLAQWALESAWGKRTSGPNNFFGMKALAGQPCAIVTTHEVYKGQRVEVKCAFRAFASPGEAFEAHAKLLATGAAYAPFRAAIAAKLPLDRAVDLLGHGTPARPSYATDPDYGPKLMAIIRGSNLIRYDA